MNEFLPISICGCVCLMPDMCEQVGCNKVFLHLHQARELDAYEAALNVKVIIAQSGMVFLFYCFSELVLMIFAIFFITHTLP